MTAPARIGPGRLAAAFAVAVALGAGATAVHPAGADTPSPIERARRAAATTTYSGTVTVRWRDGEGLQTQTLQVRSSRGVMRVEGGAKLAATPNQRWMFRDGAWDLMSPPGLSQLAVDTPPKYRTVSAAGPPVAGRPTQLVQLLVGDRIEERWFLDEATGLVLGRQQVDAAGREIRLVAFDAIDLGAGAAVAAPVGGLDMRPRATGHASAPYVAPGSLPGGYQRVAILKRTGALQVVYTDGVHGLSMFEQRGRLDRSSVPAGGQPVAVGPSGGYRYVYAGGQVVVWQASGSTYTVVGDGVPDEVLTAARSVPVRRTSSPFQRLRRACHEVVEALSGP